MDTIHQSPQGSEKKTSKFVHTSVIIAIVIVLNLFSAYAVSLVYNEPSYSKYVPETQVIEDITTKATCLATGGQWTESASPVEKGKTKIEGSCDVNYTNRLNYEKAHEAYEKNVFITLIIYGVALLALAGFITVQILSISFAWGGVLSLIIASIRYWSLANGVSRVVILALALALLIWLAVKKFSK